MKTITLNCEIITPMFAGSAIPGMCELRPPAIKGALRFWWRALNAHLPVKQLRIEEAELFGSSDENVGRSSIQITLRQNLKATLPTFEGKGKKFQVISSRGTFQINILDYLAYGFHQPARPCPQYTKPCYLPGQRFELQFFWDCENARLALSQALNALQRFGGLGARTRNGWGNFTILNLPDNWPQSTRPTIAEQKSDYIGFSAASSLFTSKNSFDTWDLALADVGKIYHDARQSLERKHYYARRVMVAQPIIANRDEVDTMFLERHGKSMFLSVGHEGGRYRGHILFLPYDFPKGIDRSNLSRKPKPSNIAAISNDYQSVHNDLNRFFKSQMNCQIL